MILEYNERIADLATLYDLNDLEIESLVNLYDTMPETLDMWELKQVAEEMAAGRAYPNE